MGKQMPIGTKIKIIRIKNGMTQKDLSKKTGISLSLLSKYRNRRQNPH